MAYEKFALNFTLIDQIVYEIITDQFTPIPVAAYKRIDLKVPGDNNVDDASAADYAAVGDYEDQEPAVKKKRGDRGSRRKKKAGGLFIKKLIS